MREINPAEITVVSGACLVGMMGDVSQCEMNVPELMNKVIAPDTRSPFRKQTGTRQRSVLLSPLCHRRFWTIC